MTSGLIVVVVAVAIAGGLGLWRLAGDGRFRGTRAVPRATADESAAREQLLLDAIPNAGAVGERATFLQFSSAFCAPCRATRRVLAEVAELVPGVAHVEVDAEQHLDLVRRAGVLRTPTTLVLDGSGREVSRASGAPTKQAAIASLGFLASSPEK